MGFPSRDSNTDRARLNNSRLRSQLRSPSGGVAFAFAEDVGVEPVPWLDVDTPVADDAAGAGADPLLAEGKPEAPPPAAEVPDDPPHAASSSTSDPSPVAAAHPLLRITSPISFG